MNIPILEPGKYYHIYNRATDGLTLFDDNEACRFFLRLYKTHVVPVAETYAYCLLPDHIHLLVRTRLDVERSLYRPFAILFSSYSNGCQKHRGTVCKVFHYKLKRVEIRSPALFRDMVCYVNQNPWRHGLTDHPGNYRFSSFRSTITTFPTLIERERLIDHFGCFDNLNESLHSQVEELRIGKFILEK